MLLRQTRIGGSDGFVLPAQIKPLSGKREALRGKAAKADVGEKRGHANTPRNK